MPQNTVHCSTGDFILKNSIQQLTQRLFIETKSGFCFYPVSRVHWLHHDRNRYHNARDHSSTSCSEASHFILKAAFREWQKKISQMSSTIFALETCISAFVALYRSGADRALIRVITDDHKALPFQLASLQLLYTIFKPFSRYCCVHLPFHLKSDGQQLMDVTQGLSLFFLVSKKEICRDAFQELKIEITLKRSAK